MSDIQRWRPKAEISRGWHRSKMEPVDIGEYVLYADYERNVPQWRTNDPPEDGWYLVTVAGREDYDIEIDWWKDREWVGGDVLAWMPKPEPFGGAW